MKKKNLNLTYAVRDGIISHCGEVDQNCIKPRDFKISLKKVQKGGAMQSATWEGCVVKLADKIAYLGRDIEDAARLGYFTSHQLSQIRDLARKCKQDAINTTVITHSMIIDICRNSTPDKGLCLSPEMDAVLNSIKEFNYKNIYRNDRLSYYTKYADLIINSLFEALVPYYKRMDTFAELEKDDFHHRKFIKDFGEYLSNYCHMDSSVPDWARPDSGKLENKKIYGYLETKKIYYRAIIDFIAGMTDNYAVDAFNQLLMC